MSKPTFDEKYIAAALDLAAKATPRPWHAESLASGVRHLERNCSDWYFDDVPDGFHLPGRNGGDGGSVDGNYIALAASDFPAALEEIRALRQQRVREANHYLQLCNAVEHQRMEIADERARADKAEAEVKWLREQWEQHRRGCPKASYVKAE